MVNLEATIGDVLILLGPPGSGKGSQAVLLKEKLGFEHVSTGDLLRESIKQKTALGVKIQSFMDQGLLAPDDLVIDILFEKIHALKHKKGVILDGFPRTLSQAAALQKRLGEKAHVIAINLVVNDEEILLRLTRRIVCQACGAPYNLQFSPPKIAGTCDQCKGSLSQRSDDTHEVVQKRLAVYHKQTAPLIDYYEKQGVLYSIDSKKSKENILSQILEVVESRAASLLPK